MVGLRTKGSGLLLAVEDVFLRFLHLGVTRSHCAEVAGADDRGAVAVAEEGNLLPPPLSARKICRCRRRREAAAAQEEEGGVAT